MMQANEPQTILASITEAAIFLTLTVEPAGLRSSRSAVRRQRTQPVGRFPDSRGRADCVVGVGAALWDRLFGVPPAVLHPFRELNGASYRAPATRGDLFFHLRAHRGDGSLGIGSLKGMPPISDSSWRLLTATPTTA